MRKSHLGLNVARLFGDPREFGGVISQKTQMISSNFQAGDVLVVACDGLKDFVSEEEIIKQVSVKEDPKPLVERLLDCVPGKAGMLKTI